ncbi:MAG: type II toxin-antitoxin system VapB family antitoxin [Candidatus Symbiodolus clandestinus]
MEQTTLFKHNQSQAVRLPKVVAFPDNVKQVDIIALGCVWIVSPVGETWDSWFANEAVDADFMVSREQPNGQQRQVF